MTAYTEQQGLSVDYIALVVTPLWVIQAFWMKDKNEPDGEKRWLQLESMRRTTTDEHWSTKLVRVPGDAAFQLADFIIHQAPTMKPPKQPTAAHEGR